MGDIRGHLGSLGGHLGVIWGCCCYAFGKGRSRRVPGSDLGGIWEHFGAIWEVFGRHLEGFGTILGGFSVKKLKTQFLRANKKQPQSEQPRP